MADRGRDGVSVRRINPAVARRQPAGLTIGREPGLSLSEGRRHEAHEPT